MISSDYYSETMRIEFFGRSIEEISEVADGLSEHFFQVVIVKRPAPPAATPLFGDFAVILLAISIAAQGFLSELGKDTYRGLRGFLITAAQKAQSIRDGRGGYTMGLQIERPGSNVTFAFINPPDDADLKSGLETIPDILSTVSRDREVFAVWDRGKGEWHVEEASDEVMEAKQRSRSRKLAYERLERDPELVARIRKAFGSRPDLPPGEEYVEQMKQMWAGLLKRRDE